MYDNRMVSVATVCRARMDILRAEPVLQAAHEVVVRVQPCPGVVWPLVAWASSGVCPRRQA
jgi:hypothetical protein